MKSRNIMILAVLGTVATGCATARTRYSDPVMRVMIDPDSIEEMHYTRVQKALVTSGKWTVVDRGAAYQAVKKEQERQHRDDSSRFESKEKWAHWGKLYGVGGIVAAQAQCEVVSRFWSSSPTLRCLQYLAVVDARTGEVITAVENESDDGKTFYGEMRIAPSWDETVDMLNKAFPKYFESDKRHDRLIKYQAESEELAKQKE